MLENNTLQIWNNPLDSLQTVLSLNRLSDKQLAALQEKYIEKCMDLKNTIDNMRQETVALDEALESMNKHVGNAKGSLRIERTMGNAKIVAGNTLISRFGR